MTSVHERAVSDSTPPVEVSDESEAPGGVALRKRAGIALIVAVVVLGGIVFITRSRSAPAEAAPLVDNDAPRVEGSVVRFSPAFAERAGITTAAVEQAELAPFVSVAGTLIHDPRHFAAIGARIQGRVRRPLKFVGDMVKRDEPIAEIESAELGRAQAAVLSSRAKEEAARADDKRERQLADAKVTPERDAEVARANYTAVRAERLAAERTLEALGGDLNGPPGLLVVRSPIEGRVVSSSAALGRTVEPSDTLFEVAELGTLFVELRVFERELTGVRAGNSVEIVAANFKDPIASRVAHVGEIIDVDTRTAPVRVLVSNPDGALRPGQSVTARIHLTTTVSRMPTVPRAAVTQIDGRPTLFVLRDATTVEPRSVVVGAEDANRIGLREGVAEGERVVVGGMFAIKSELFR